MKIKVFAMRCSENNVFKGRIEEIENTLKAKQKFVGGYIQNVVVNGIDVICNDEGKLKGLPANRVWVEDDTELIDVFVGNIMACNHDSKGNYTDIKESDIPKLLDALKPVAFITDEHILCYKEECLPEYKEEN